MLFPSGINSNAGTSDFSPPVKPFQVEQCWHTWLAEHINVWTTHEHLKRCFTQPTPAKAAHAFSVLF